MQFGEPLTWFSIGQIFPNESRSSSTALRRKHLAFYSLPGDGDDNGAAAPSAGQCGNKCCQRLCHNSFHLRPTGTGTGRAGADPLTTITHPHSFPVVGQHVADPKPMDSSSWLRERLRFEPRPKE